MRWKSTSRVLAISLTTLICQQLFGETTNERIIEYIERPPRQDGTIIRGLTEEECRSFDVDEVETLIRPYLSVSDSRARQNAFVALRCTCIAHNEISRLIDISIEYLEDTDVWLRKMIERSILSIESESFSIEQRAELSALAMDGKCSLLILGNVGSESDIDYLRSQEAQARNLGHSLWAAAKLGEASAGKLAIDRIEETFSINGRLAVLRDVLDYVQNDTVLEPLTDWIDDETMIIQPDGMEPLKFSDGVIAIISLTYKDFPLETKGTYSQSERTAAKQWIEEMTSEAK